ncbi:hypothetical protein CEUSTIGMA_g6252.t1 [Chlamydomonas eustigma]|uniref:Sugar phosphate transporter domain-containing protein n=1 Tax=Chlamydomonas eustigma TaxID=1157962 RepID=A0A250X6X4_9CHLO|nr:hypothetical protein CEUSTIGMA_g6252.t1 [Chlamydomonas eustigma]|eukprot:GAX78815.1 hypothetical protein CEUSTIGMA_g6252.t1 [Chlamydomonas eustigma]
MVADSGQLNQKTGRMAGGSSVDILGHISGLPSAILYGSMAVAMNFINKYMVQMFPLSNVVMILQMVVTWAILHVLLVLGYLNFPHFSWGICRQLFFVTVLYTANTAFALIGLKTLNVPMYNTLKRLTPIIVLGVKALLYRRMPANQITLSVLLVVLGCIVAGVGDLTFDIYGYIYALLSCLCQATYLLLVEFQGAGGITTSEMLYYNAVTSLPLLMVIVGITGEWAVILHQYHMSIEQHGLAWFWIVSLSCSTMGCILNYSLFLCTMLNSALTTTIVGVLKSVVAVVLGFFLLGGVPYSFVNILGICLNTIGGVWYSLHKYGEKLYCRPLMASGSSEPYGGESIESAVESGKICGARASGGNGGTASGQTNSGDDMYHGDGVSSVVTESTSLLSNNLGASNSAHGRVRRPGTQQQQQ